jgi:hypothetical protein
MPARCIGFGEAETDSDPTDLDFVFRNPFTRFFPNASAVLTNEHAAEPIADRAEKEADCGPKRFLYFFPDA